MLRLESSHRSLGGAVALCVPWNGNRIPVGRHLSPEGCEESTRAPFNALKFRSNRKSARIVMKTATREIPKGLKNGGTLGSLKN